MNQRIPEPADADASAAGRPARTNLTGRIGRWSAQHRRTAVIGWMVFVVVALFTGGSLERGELTGADQLLGSAAAAQRMLDEAGIEDEAVEMVLVQAGEEPGRATPEPAAVEAALADLARELARTEHVRDVLTPAQQPGLVSGDKTSSMVTFVIDGDPETAAERVEPSQRTVEQVAARHADLTVEQFGATSANVALEEVLSEDLKTAELLSLPITLAVLLIAFGALVAALLPLGFALTAFLAALGLLGFSSQLFPVNGGAQTVMLLVGLAVGVDYSLFYVKREREERALGATSAQAIERAAATAGHSVLVSGLTVMVAMAGMFLAGFPVFTGMGTATILVVATSVVGSLTVLPALMSALGDRVDKGRLPLLGRRIHEVPGVRGVWPRLVTQVLRRPVLAVLASVAVLGGLAFPATGLELRNEGVDDLPRDLPVMQTYDRLQAAFPGGPAPALVVVEAEDVRAATVRRGIERMREQVLASGEAREPFSVRESEDNSVVLVEVPLVGDGEDAESQAALATLKRIAQENLGGIDGVEHEVGGSTASSIAFKDLMRERTPLVVGFVLTLAFVLLMFSFRSVVIAVTAIVLNLLSVAAAYGAMVLVFQHGVGADLIGLTSTGPLVNWLPLFLFVILFGLSMDYHVLVLSRIREARAAGASTSVAIRDGISVSAGVITSAAMIMVFVFLCFVPLSMVSMKQIGLGLAVAVLLDATLVRAVLLPAVMQLLGEWNWWAPRWLARPIGQAGTPVGPAADVAGAARTHEREGAGV